jgi:methylenetetrahydrofolate dehydrogenase (NADP+)/methenyltetrahydrofolate cyclohydrolase
MNTVLYGKPLAEELRGKIRTEISELYAGKRPPSLAVIIPGNDPASIYYAKLIEKAGAKEGIKVVLEHIPEPEQDTLIKFINKLNADDSIDAVQIQLPLPVGIDKKVIFNALSPEKDVDGQTPLNLGKLLSKQEGTFPATARAVIKILEGNNISISGKKTVVIGRSTTVGFPAAVMLIHQNATVTVCHSKSKPLEDYTMDADILVVSAGIPELIKRNHVKEGAVVIDVGTNEVDGKIVGDVDFDEVSQIASVSPATGGVGALTLACLFENTYDIYRKNIQRHTNK